MQVTIESINSVTKKVCFEISAEKVDAEIEKTFFAIQKKAKLQGFRPGKAPLTLIKRSYSDSMRNEVMNNFFKQTLYNALNEHKIDPVDSPTIESDLLEAGKPFKYSALVEIMPEILLNDYKGLKISKEKFSLDPANIDGEIKRMQENMAQLTPIEESDVAVENGHTVVIDYKFFIDGFPVESDEAKDIELEIGSKKMIPGFEEQIIGMTRGLEKTIKITLPEGYQNKDAVGKEGVFQVTVNEIKKKELPELDDDFAQQFGDYETMDDLRAKMAEYLEKQESDRIENDLKERVITALVEKNLLDVPQSMVKRQLDYMLENLKNRLKGQQMSIEMMGLDEVSFRERFKNTAEEKVKGGLLLMALVEKEAIAVSDEDLEQRYEQLSAGNVDMLARIKDYYSVNKQALNGIVSEIKENKAIQILLDNAVITEVEKAALETAVAE